MEPPKAAEPKALRRPALGQWNQKSTDAEASLHRVIHFETQASEDHVRVNSSSNL